MFKKLLLTVVLLSFIIIPISAEYTVTTNITDHSITYYFSPDINKNDKIFFDNEQLNFWPENELIMCGLKSSTCYRLTIQNLPYTSQHIQTYTLPLEEEPFYAQYGIIGLFILITALIALSAKTPYTGYIAVLLSTIGFIYVLKQEPDFFTSIIFAILIFVSTLVTTLTFNRE